MPQTSTTGYQGLFTFPTHTGTWSTAYSTGAFTFRYDNGLKFFATAHVYSGGQVYMINSPGFAKTNFASAPVATLIKNFGDIYNGNKCVDNDGGTCTPSGGAATYGLYFDPSSSKLYWNYGHWYNATNPYNPSFGYSTVSGSGVNTTIVGKAAYRLTNRPEKFARGGATPIPNWFANRFTAGKNLAVGFGGYFSIISSGSLGAALTAVSEPDISVNAHKSYLDNIPLVGYPSPAHQERDPNYNSRYYNGAGDPPGAWNPLNGKGFYTWSDILYQGCTWIDRAQSQGVLCIIKVCQGEAFYQTSDRHCVGGGAFEWFIFDPKQLAQAAQGIIPQQQVQPVSYWVDSDLPLTGTGWTGDGLQNVSVTYNPISDEVYVLNTSEYKQGCCEWYPVLRSWKLGGN